MKLLFDQNISYRILKKLPEKFGDSTHVKSEGLINEPDEKIWNFAKINHLTIVTQDSDFNDLYLIKGFPPKIIWIRTGNIDTETVLIVLEHYYKELKLFEENSDFGCFEIRSIFKK